MDQKVLSSPRALTCRYSGIVPPENSMVKKNTMEKKFRPHSRLRESGYAVTADRETAMIVPTIITSRELR